MEQNGISGIQSLESGHEEEKEKKKMEEKFQQLFDVCFSVVSRRWKHAEGEGGQRYDLASLPGLL